ncbi:uncharacterized protein K452DRAFT_224808 [Aplosporella prunicola CBS 121167]|uniref:RNA helicase n=1 Tax=Aplosporella prunicola CBS 121167 TaxID=1176127 RepID=A0A6A6BHV1_9PEZI|nr:uncharacterized protein K452DRAFT_224808 [Aplosporella prunicola CBS 121167]KAF2143576.1 hypothetical protein K452DRAFT_224808 [Aplosporella prunicola CBS 121167]
MKNIELSFVGHVASQRAFSQNDFYNQKAMADLRYPIEWYPRTRATPRKIICHVGPTNSGKTYHALKRLEESGNGVYAGPLRLLAHEVYTRLNAKSLNCNLVTGEERRSPPAGDAGLLYACTVEMVPLNHEFEVAVLDEIQMIGDAHRGWAWTQALLGVQAKEIHVCGEERTVPLLREIAAMTGDSFEVNTYKRLTTLSMDTAPFGTDWSKLEKGDCIVTFTVKDIHLLRTRIEKQTKKKVAIVYGGLPPETRAAQARLFNDPDSGYDFLVASDAIGMGLNLSIKRIIFETTTKFNGVDMVPLTIPETKQIAGRAGRYRTAAQDNEAARKEKEGGANTSATPKNDSKAPKEEPSGGIVTAFRYQDFKRIAKCLQTDAEIIRAAGLFPPSSIIERFANYFPPGTPFSYIMVRLHDISRVHTRFRLCSLKDQLTIADVIHGVEGLSISDRITFTAAPANFKSPSDRTALISMAEFVAQQKDGSLLNIKGLPFDILDQEPDGSREYLFGLEQLHRGIILYLWLSYRFAGVFTTRNLAFHAKAVVEQAIEDTLVRFSTVAEYERRLQAKEARAQAREKTRQEFKERLQARKEEDARRGSEQLQEEGEGEEEEEREEEDYGREILDGADEGSVDILDGAEEGADIRPVKHEEQPVPIAADGAVEVKELDLKEGENEKRPEAEEDETEVDASALDNPLVEFDETEEDQVREEKEDGEQKEEKEAKGQ